MKKNEISTCVEHAVARYFADLDGERPAGLYEMVIREVERPLLAAVMEHAGSNQTQAAEMLGITRNTLRRKLTDHGLL